MSTSIKKTYSKKEYDKHCNFMYDLGKASAFQSILKTEVMWSVNLLSQPHGFKYQSWNLDTVIFGDGDLKDIVFINQILTDDKDEKGDYIYQTITSKAKDATVKEIWLAAERSYRIAKEEYGDWHKFLEGIEIFEGSIWGFFGS